MWYDRLGHDDSGMIDWDMMTVDELIVLVPCLLCGLVLLYMGVRGIIVVMFG